MPQKWWRGVAICKNVCTNCCNSCLHMHTMRKISAKLSISKKFLNCMHMHAYMQQKCKHENLNDTICNLNMHTASDLCDNTHTYSVHNPVQNKHWVSRNVYKWQLGLTLMVRCLKLVCQHFHAQNHSNDTVVVYIMLDKLELSIIFWCHNVGQIYIFKV